MFSRRTKYATQYRTSQIDFLNYKPAVEHHFILTVTQCVFCNQVPTKRISLYGSKEHQPFGD